MKQESHLNKRWMVGQPRPAEQAIARPASAVIARRLLMILILAAVGLRLWYIAINPIDPGSSTADDGDYYRRALRFAITGLYVDDSWLIRPPLHVFFFAAWLRIGVLLGNLKLGLLLIQLAQTALGTLNVLLGFGIARRLFRNPWAGLLFAAFLALWFPFVEQPSVLFSELLYSTLFLTHFWLLLRFDASGRLGTLALSGMALGAAALSRSPALYSLAFVVVWLFVRRMTNDERRTTNATAWLSYLRPSSIVLRQSVLVIACSLAVVLPWTARNYIVYQRIIPVDTLGQINMWLDLDKVEQRTANIETLRKLPQADRQAYAMARAKEILAADPLKPFRSMWPTFQHIWKAQFVEDYLVKESFYDRPLRATAPLGLFGDVLWLVFTAGGLVGLAAPPREGWHNRLFVLAWVGYTLFTVLIFHVEPRYLLPLWMMIALYGAGALSWLIKRDERRTTNDEGISSQPHAAIPKHGLHSSFVRRLSSILQIALLAAFALLLVTYRDYPAIISQGLTREWWMRAGDNAFARGDYTGAAQDYRTAAAVQPSFLDSKLRLALAQLAQGHNAEAQATVAGVNLRTAQFVGELATPGGGPQKAADFNAVEATIGLDVQQWTRQWLRPPATTAVQLGNGTDLGYIAGFSGSEQSPTGSYRWLSNAGKFVLPLPAPLQPGATVVLRVAAPQPTPLTVAMGSQRMTVTVTSGQWREYIVPAPTELAGQQSLTVELSAPPFIPLYQNPASNDMRQLSVMISDIWVK